MFWKKKPSWTDDEIARVSRVLKTHEVGSKEYNACVVALNDLHGMASEEDQVSKDVLVTVAANLLGILMIIKHEELNPIVSKALQFVIRPKV
jgi:hypothetical protein